MILPPPITQNDTSTNEDGGGDNIHNGTPTATISNNHNNDTLF